MKNIIKIIDKFHDDAKKDLYMIKDNFWYDSSFKAKAISYALMPFTALFYLISTTRRYLYKFNILKSTKVSVPIIVVGGINVGGTGKTPLSIYLIKSLQEKGYKVGLLSRGYKSQCKSFPYEVLSDSNFTIAGDEPLLIKTKTNATVVIDPIRSRGAQFLCSKGVDVIVMDDGLQHYALKRDFEIIVVDGKRKFGNGFLMPSGPLREGLWHLKKANAVVINGLDNFIDDAFWMTLKPSSVTSLDGKEVFLDKSKTIYALAGIGNPTRFVQTLIDLGFGDVHLINIGDHARLDDKSLLQYTNNFPVIMTAKDAVKYASLKDTVKNLYMVDIEAYLDDSFINRITKFLDSESSVNKKSKC